MVGAIKAKLVKVEKRNFKNEAGEDVSYWRATLSDPDSDWPFHLTIDNDLGEHVLSNAPQVDELLNKDCMFTVKISTYRGQVKLKCTDIQVGSTPKS